MPDTESASLEVSDAPESALPSSPELGGDVSSPEAKTNDQNGDQQKPQSHQQKRESRYERTKRQRAAFQQREAALKQREDRFAQVERERNAPKKPDYSVADLKKYRQSWENEGRFDLVEQADKEIKRLESLEQQEVGQQSFVNEWHQAEAELAQADPEFGFGKGTRLDKQLSEIMKGPDGNIYRQHPRGIVAAYHRAKMELLEGDHKTALGKIQQLENELKRVTGLTSIGGGVPGRMGGGRVENINDFSKLSSKDMLKHLKSRANQGDMPWL